IETVCHPLHARLLRGSRWLLHSIALRPRGHGRARMRVAYRPRHTSFLARHRSTMCEGLLPSVFVMIVAAVGVPRHVVDDGCSPRGDDSARGRRAAEWNRAAGGSGVDRFPAPCALLTRLVPRRTRSDNGSATSPPRFSPLNAFPWHAAR